MLKKVINSIIQVFLIIQTGPSQILQNPKRASGVVAQMDHSIMIGPSIYRARGHYALWRSFLVVRN